MWWGFWKEVHSLLNWILDKQRISLEKIWKMQFMNNNEGIPEEEDLDVPMIKTKLEEEKKEVNEDDAFDEPIDKPIVG